MPASLQSCATGLPAALPASTCLRISMICSGLRLDFFMGVPLRITLTLRGPGRGGQTTRGLQPLSVVVIEGVVLGVVRVLELKEGRNVTFEALVVAVECREVADDKPSHAA